MRTCTCPWPSSSSMPATTSGRTSPRPSHSPTRRPRVAPGWSPCPEYLQFRGTDDGFRASARSIPGPHTEPFAEVARRRGAWILVGSTAETSGDPARPFNTSALIAPDGAIAATYRKVHLFDVDIDQGPADTESARVTPGDRLVLRRHRRRATRPVDLLRPALPGAVPLARAGRCRDPDGPVRLHRADRARPLGGPPSGAGDRERGVRARAVADRRTARPARLRAVDGHRSVGDGHRPGAGCGHDRARRPRPRAHRRGAARDPGAGQPPPRGLPDLNSKDPAPLREPGPRTWFWVIGFRRRWSA